MLLGCSPNDRVLDAVKAHLKDPESAQFRELVRMGDDRCLSGEVNSKNSFGGYVGFTKFITDGKDVKFDDQSIEWWAFDREHDCWRRRSLKP